MSPEPIGTDSLEIEIEEMVAEPPDVENPREVPGGKLTSLTPQGANVPRTRRNQYALGFQVPQATLLVIKRIYAQIPIYLTENKLEESSTSDTQVTHYKTEAEAGEATEGAGGQASSGGTTQPIGYDQPYTSTERDHAHKRIGTDYYDEETTTTKRSILPLTINVNLTLTAPDGILWAESFDVDMHPARQEFPEPLWQGTGLIANYADLVNPIRLRPDKQVYGLGVSVLVPAQVASEVVVGPEFGSNDSNFGQVTLFYDLENAALGK